MDKEAARIEHLKLIEEVVSRLARSSFTIKAAASTVTVALVAAAVATEDPLVTLGGVPIVSVWILDAYYLWQERRFRDLYDVKRLGPASDFGTDEFFSMVRPTQQRTIKAVLKSALSTSLLLLYLPLLGLVAGAALIAAIR